MPNPDTCGLTHKVASWAWEWRVGPSALTFSPLQHALHCIAHMANSLIAHALLPSHTHADVLRKSPYLRVSVRTCGMSSGTGSPLCSLSRVCTVSSNSWLPPLLANRHPTLSSSNFDMFRLPGSYNIEATVKKCGLPRRNAVAGESQCDPPGRRPRRPPRGTAS